MYEKTFLRNFKTNNQQENRENYQIKLTARIYLQRTKIIFIFTDIVNQALYKNNKKLYFVETFKN